MKSSFMFEFSINTEFGVDCMLDTRPPTHSTFSLTHVLLPAVFVEQIMGKGKVGRPPDIKMALSTFTR